MLLSESEKRNPLEFIADLDGQAAQDAARQLRRSGAPAARGLECDVSDRGSVLPRGEASRGPEADTAAPPVMMTILQFMTRQVWKEPTPIPSPTLSVPGVSRYRLWQSSRFRDCLPGMGKSGS